VKSAGHSWRPEARFEAADAQEPRSHASRFPDVLVDHVPLPLSRMTAAPTSGAWRRIDPAIVRDHDGFRILARRDSAGVRLITREVCMSDPARVQGLVPEPPDDPQPLWPPR
jgi:hypothetical protein